MKKLLLLNGSHSELTLLREAKKLGYYVITSGNMPKGIVHKYADKYIPGDYSDYELMYRIANENNIDSVVSCANDFGIISASYIAEKMGLGGHDSFEITKLLHHKDEFKSFALANDLQVPPSYTYSSVGDAVMHMTSAEYPLIIKPVDLTGGKGVKKVNNDVEYKNAVKDAFERSREKKIVVEKYINGKYHSFSTFLVDHKVVAYYSDDEYSFINPYFVATSCGPASDADTAKNVLIGQAECIAERLDLVNGVFHMQYVTDKNNIPYIIDITRRCSGDIYPEPVEHSTGLPWSKWIVASESGYKSDFFIERGTQKKICGRHCVMAENNGKIKSINISDSLKNNIYKKVMWKGPGDCISDYLVDKCGVLFWEFASVDEMQEKIMNVKKLVKVEVE